MKRVLECHGPRNEISLYGGLRTALVHAGYTTLRGKEPSYGYGAPLAPVAFTSPTEYFDAQISPSLRSRGMTYDLQFGIRLAMPFPLFGDSGGWDLDRGPESVESSSSSSVYTRRRHRFTRHIGHERMIAALVDIVQQEHAVLRKMGIARRK